MPTGPEPGALTRDAAGGLRQPGPPEAGGRAGAARRYRRPADRMPRSRRQAASDLIPGTRSQPEPTGRPLLLATVRTRVPPGSSAAGRAVLPWTDAVRRRIRPHRQEATQTIETTYTATDHAGDSRHDVEPDQLIEHARGALGRAAERAGERPHAQQRRGGKHVNCLGQSRRRPAGNAVGDSRAPPIARRDRLRVRTPSAPRARGFCCKVCSGWLIG